MGVEAFVRGWQMRLHYLVCTVAVMALGLASRRYSKDVPVFVAEYAGDTLWALMVFFGVSTVAPFARISQRARVAIAFSFTVEISQLYHSPWLEAVRRTAIGGLVPGFGFVWTDLVCYAAGVSIGAMIDYPAYSKVHDDARNGSTGAAYATIGHPTSDGRDWRQSLSVDRIPNTRKVIPRVSYCPIN